MSHFREPPKKSLGQHFLHDRGVIEKIVLAVDPQPGDRLFEIGPGQGAITFPLLRRHGALTVIEFDRDLITPLMESAVTFSSEALRRFNEGLSGFDDRDVIGGKVG
jgi:16S rRNA (adenine1518-N6/adenine1519-N6)-dimethyltransferase